MTVCSYQAQYIYFLKRIFFTYGISVLLSEAKFEEKHRVWDPMPELTITSPYVHSRVDSNTFIMGGQPYTRVDISHDSIPQSGTFLTVLQDGVCTDFFENLNVISLKGDLSNATTFYLRLFSLVNIFIVPIVTFLYSLEIVYLFVTACMCMQWCIVHICMQDCTYKNHIHIHTIHVSPPFSNA